MGAQSSESGQNILSAIAGAARKLTEPKPQLNPEALRAEIMRLHGWHLTEHATEGDPTLSNNLATSAGESSLAHALTGDKESATKKSWADVAKIASEPLPEVIQVRPRSPQSNNS